MDIITAIKERRSVRGFSKKLVSLEIIKAIFQAARWTPSGVNHQPWKVAILDSVTPEQQALRQQIRTQIIAAREQGIPENPDYDYYPKVWAQPYKSRRKACGQALYSALDINIEETEKRKTQWYKNYHFFDAPVGLVFYLEKHLAKGSWVDIGMFIQNVMLAARHYELETCAQASLAEYPDIIRQALNISDDYHIVCGMAMGYADWSHPVNQYRTTREEFETFGHFGKAGC